MVGKLNSDAAAATAAAAAGPKSGQALADQIVQRARDGGAEGEPDYIEQEAHDFEGQSFVKCKPLMKLVGADNPQWAPSEPKATAAQLQFAQAEDSWGPPIRCKAVNHIAIGADDVDAICRFYTKVLGFREIPRPELGFPGHWLKGLGLMIHVIQHDPQVPRRHNDWKEQYQRDPEAWFIRRGTHIALEVEDFEDAERGLRRHGVEYSRFVLPDVGMKQLFTFDPEGNGIEIGEYRDTWHFLKEHGEDKGWLGE